MKWLRASNPVYSKLRVMAVGHEINLVNSISNKEYIAHCEDTGF